MMCTNAYHQHKLQKVDKQKLEKAELKLKEKKEKREGDVKKPKEALVFNKISNANY